MHEKNGIRICIDAGPKVTKRRLLIAFIFLYLHVSLYNVLYIIYTYTMSYITYIMSYTQYNICIYFPAPNPTHTEEIGYIVHGAEVEESNRFTWN